MRRGSTTGHYSQGLKFCVGLDILRLFFASEALIFSACCAVANPPPAPANQGSHGRPLVHMCKSLSPAGGSTSPGERRGTVCQPPNGPGGNRTSVVVVLGHEMNYSVALGQGLSFTRAPLFPWPAPPEQSRQSAINERFFL